MSGLQPIIRYANKGCVVQFTPGHFCSAAFALFRVYVDLVPFYQAHSQPDHHQVFEEEEVQHEPCSQVPDFFVLEADLMRLNHARFHESLRYIFILGIFERFSDTNLHGFSIEQAFFDIRRVLIIIIEFVFLHRAQSGSLVVFLKLLRNAIVELDLCLALICRGSYGFQ